MTNEQRSLLFVIGVVSELISLGLIEGPKTLTPKGISAFDQLLASGYRPRREELTAAIVELGLPPVTVTLVEGWVNKDPRIVQE